LLVLATLLLALAAVGCGTSPTSPLAPGNGTVAPPPSGPELLKLNADGTVSFVTMPRALQSGTLLDPFNDQVFDPTRALTASARIDGLLGGRIVCGRYVATVPPGAFIGVGVITMSLPDSTLMVCDLQISPAELNAFLVPVDLALHTTGTDADTDSLDVYWWNPENETWTSMGCQKSLLDRVLQPELLSSDPVEGVQLELNHFSRYAAGKAGW
jgi:hypothetical protein